MSVEQIQALADGLADRLGWAVVVDDRDLRLVAASKEFGDADPARVWSLLHRRTRPEDVRLEEIARLTGPGYVAENPALELWQRLCVPIRQEIGVLLHARLVTGERERALRQELAEQLLGQDAARSVARDEAVDLAVDGQTDYPIAAFSMDRPAVRDPAYPSDFLFTRAAQAATAEGSLP